MAVFYLLPPRPFLGDRFAAFLQAFFPGLTWDVATRLQLADVYAAALADRPDVFIIYREDLPAGEPTERALVEGCGAEPGDEVVEVRPSGHAGEVVTVRWTVPPRPLHATQNQPAVLGQASMADAAQAPSPPANLSASRN